jgi:hypothetical protein
MFGFGGGNGAFDFVSQNCEVIGQLCEKLALRWIGGQIADQSALGCAGTEPFKLSPLVSVPQRN